MTEASPYITVHYRNGIHASSHCKDNVQTQTPYSCLNLDLSIPWDGSSRKNPGFSGRENPTHDRPMGRIEPQFSGQARACAFYSVK
jgi:hypothetical protein